MPKYTAFVLTSLLMLASCGGGGGYSSGGGGGGGGGGGATCNAWAIARWAWTVGTACAAAVLSAGTSPLVA